jgi:hypothetical protein
MMLADWNDGARLGTHRTLGMLRDKTHFIAHREPVEPAIGNAVAVEVDLVAVGGQDETAIALGEEAGDAPMLGDRVQLHLAAPLANMIFEHPAGGVEGVANRDIDILMRVVRRRIAADCDLAAGNFEVDADPEQIALTAARVPAFHDNPARDDTIEEPFELPSPLAYARRDGLRGIHMTESNLKRKLHRVSLFGPVEE